MILCWLHILYLLVLFFLCVNLKKKKKIRELPVVWGVYISQITHSKSCLAVILSCQSTFYNQWFVRYGFLAALRLLGTNWSKNWFWPTFSLITNSILKIDLLRTLKQLLPWSFQKLDNHSPSLTSLYLMLHYLILHYFDIILFEVLLFSSCLI